MAAYAAAKSSNRKNDEQCFDRLHEELLSKVAPITDGGHLRFNVAVYGTFVNTSLPS